MRIGWFGLSDEEYVGRIRIAHDGMHRWKWCIAGFILILLICCTLLWVAIARIATDDFIYNPPAPFNTYSHGLGNGFLIGFFAAFVLPGICLSVPILLMELRTCRLLLAYHDRLQQAGLLPGDSVETISSAKREPPRN